MLLGLGVVWFWCNHYLAADAGLFYDLILQSSIFIIITHYLVLKRSQAIYISNIFCVFYIGIEDRGVRAANFLTTFLKMR